MKGMVAVMLFVCGCGYAPASAVVLGTNSNGGKCPEFSESLFTADLPITNLRVGTDGAAFILDGDVYWHSFVASDTIVLMDGADGAWSSLDTYTDRVVASRITSSGEVELELRSVYDGSLLLESSFPNPRSEEISQNARARVVYRGAHLAYMRPLAGENDEWAIAMTQFGNPQELIVATSGPNAEFALADNGRIVVVPSRASNEWDKTSALLYWPDWSGEYPDTGFRQEVLSYEDGYRIRGIDLEGESVIYELDAIGAMGAGAVSGIAVTDFGEDSSTWVLAGQLLMAQSLTYTSSQMTSTHFAWMTGDADPERPAIALRSRTRDLLGPAFAEPSGIYPSDGGKISEYVLLDDEVVWVTEVDSEWSVCATALLENKTSQ